MRFEQFARFATRPERRVAVAAAASVSAGAVLLADHALSGFVLAPLAVLPILAFALAGGVWAGLGAAALVGIAFALLEPRAWSSATVDAAVLVAAYALAVLLLETARRSAAHAARLDDGMRDAKVVHDRLFPESIPNTERWTFDVMHLPLDCIGGDFYSVVVGDSATEIFIGDVSGKGLRAAMLLAAIKTLLSGTKPGAPARRLAQFNQHLFCQDGMFCTAWYGEFGDDGILHYASAGHERALVQRAGDGSIVELRGGGLPLGVEPDARFEDMSVHLGVGDRLLIYTDGLSELFAAQVVTPADVFGGSAALTPRIRNCARRDDVLALVLERRSAPIVRSLDAQRLVQKLRRDTLTGGRR